MTKQTLLLRHVFAFLLALSVFTTRGQGTCSTYTQLGADAAVSQTTTDSVGWYRFTATQTAARIVLYNNPNVNVGKMEDLYLFSGSCSSLTQLYTSNYQQRTDTSIVISAQNLTIGSAYYIKARRTLPACSCPGDTARFNLGIESTVAGGCPGATGCSMVINGSFSETVGFSSIDEPFFNNEVCNWLASHGSPQIFTGIPNTAPNAAFMWSIGNGNCPASTEGEGIVTNLTNSVLAQRDYYLSYFVKSGTPNNNNTVPQYFVRLTNMLPNSNQACLPAFGGLPIDGQANFNSNAWQQRKVCFTANANYSQLWVYPQSGVNSPQSWLGVDDIELYWIDDPGTNATFCTPTPKALGPQCPIPGATYSWLPTAGLSNPNIANPIATPTVTTTYTMTVTLPGNACVNTSIVTINVAPPTSISPNDTICTGESAQLTATGGFSYSWTPGTGLSATNIANPVATPASTTTYTVSINAYNCITTRTVTVVVYPKPSATVSGPLSTCGGAGQNYSVPFTGNTSYVWSTNPTAPFTQNINTITVDFSNNLAAGHWIIVTATDTITGCNTKDSLYAGECCAFTPFSVNTPDFYNKSSSQVAALTPAGWISVAGTNYTITGQSFSINGTFTVQGKTEFRGCDVKLGYNAKIIINPGDTLIITDNNGTASNLWACKEMWDGIYVDNSGNNGSLLTINNGSTVQDGLNAIHSDNGGQFEIYGGGTPGNVKLNKNFKAVVIKNKLAGTHPGYIRATDISCRDGVVPGKTYASAPAHTLRFPKLTKRTHIGVEITNVGLFDKMGDSTQAGYKNTFDYMDYGVKSVNSSVTIKNNEFKFITWGALLPKGSTDCPTGTAICARGNSSLLTNQRTLIVGGPGTTAPNIIRDSQVGIDAATNLNMNVRYNTVKTLGLMGITAKRIALRTVIINNNTIKDAPVGINTFDLRSCTIRIRSNSMSMKNKINAQGIVTAETFLTPLTRYNIANNVIDTVRNGITGTDLVAPKIDSNTVRLKHTTSSTVYGRGIFVQGSQKPYVRRNVIYGQNRYDWWMEGIRVDLSHADTVTCNTTSSMGTGELFSGSQPFTYFARNQMTDNIWGLLLNGGGYISPQGTTTNPNDNLWAGNFTVSQTHTFNSFGQNSPFIVQNVTGNPTYYPTINTASTTPVDQIDFFNTATAASNHDCGALSIAPNEDLALRVARDIAADAIAYPAYVQENKWMQQWALYNYLKDVPSLKDRDAAIAAFYAAADEGSLGKLYRVASTMGDAANLTAAAMQNAQLENASIEPQNAIEENWKAVNDLIITNEIEEVIVPSDGQLNELKVVARKCPISDGPAVYIARAILTAYDTTYTAYEDVCEQPPTSGEGKLMAPQKTEQAPFNLYPNPNSGEMMLAYGLGEEESGELVIYDLAGKQVMKHSLKQDQSLLLFKADLDSGIYLFKITVNGEVRKAGKLVIVK